MLQYGMTLVDDIAEQLYDICCDEVMEELGHAADAMAVQVTRVATNLGPVFILWDHHRVTLAEATCEVFAQRAPAG